MQPPFQTMRPMHFWYHCKTLNKVVCTFAVWQFEPKRTKAIEFRAVLIFDVCEFVMFTSSFAIGKAYRCRTFPDWGVGLGYHLVLGSFWECPHPWGFILHLALYFKCSEIILLMNTLHWYTHYGSRTGRWNTCTLSWTIEHPLNQEASNQWQWECNASCSLIIWQITLKKQWLVWRIMYVTPLCTPKVAVSLQ
jgi:hypothetical protein